MIILYTKVLIYEILDYIGVGLDNFNCIKLTVCQKSYNFAVDMQWKLHLDNLSKDTV